MTRPASLWYKEPWFWECFDRGLHPLKATADDILGDFEERLRTGSGDRVLLEASLYRDDLEGSQNPLEEAQWLYTQPETDDEYEVTMVQDVAGLTRREAEIVEFVMSGVYMGSGYSSFIGEVLGMNSVAVRKAWSRARAKLKEHWVGEA